ncbi:dihydrodipicolinate synthase family protein [Kyrpidia tusciae]|uniref:Dihydrodipicolinate synthetase n=1 Tax=Kyrpidia tusciae (strain DSM 2912 / NBRC 15312 / T2) TaxID=562970 RepID=D5WWD0_KYRT2|nr:dihydrodipicolinate synthase family protein [Kyrpidia tusciae]ADG07695.1 dihydrodipicolinate synthetase [Kyrpidia tusciae DSM 2912]
MTMNKEKFQLLKEGTVIPAHPLALTEQHELDEVHQRALTRYYIASGAGGVAVGVHTTQFEIHDVGLYEPVLRLAAQTVEEASLKRPFLKVAGVCGPTEQAVREAEIAKDLGYDLVLLSPHGLKDATEHQLLVRAAEVGKVMPLFGFYLQPSVGGRPLSYEFWRRFVEIPQLVAIKIAPFNRYQTLDVVRAVCASGRSHEIALYTGNDDSIVVDLLTTYRVPVSGDVVEKTIVGGLLGHWAVWTKRAVEIFEEVRKAKKTGMIPSNLLTLGSEITDMNAALFDPHNSFQGSIAGIHEVLKRQGLLKGIWCLNPKERLSSGQKEEIDRVYRMYPHLTDDQFVRDHLQEWLS